MDDGKEAAAAGISGGGGAAQTPLDRAHAAMIADMDDPARRAAFLEELAASGLFILLKEEARGGAIDPQLTEADGRRLVLAFDREERLAAFIREPAPNAALPGRMLVEMLAGRGIGILLNPGVAPSQWIIEPEAVDWLAGVLSSALPSAGEGRILRFLPPPPLAPELLARLDVRLARAGGLARAAWLVGVAHEGGGEGALLVFVDPLAGSEAALARAIAESLAFSDVSDPALDVAFLESGDPRLEEIARHGLRIELPAVKHGAAERLTPPAAPPGSDPEKPPRLR